MKYNIKLIDGPDTYRVYQRNQNNMAALTIKGYITPQVDGILTLSVFRDGSSSIVSQKLLACVEGFFEGETDELPVGQYTIKLELLNNENRMICSRKISHIAVGDLYLLAGQSNMDGMGKLINLEKPSKNVRCFYLNDKWGIARDPLRWGNEAVDSVYWSVSAEQYKAAAENDRYFRNSGAGLGVSFGKEMYRYNKVPVGLIICSKGATSMEQWGSDKANMEGQSLYGSLIRRVCKSGGKVRACLWYQGESDASDQYAPFYKERFLAFINSLRNDIKQPELPILYVQLASGLGEWMENSFPKWNDIQNEQLLIERECPNVAMAAAIDSTYADSIHIDTVSQRRLGMRLALLAKRICFNDLSVYIGPRPKEIGFEDERRTLLRIVYEDVNNHLKHEPKIFGFSADNKDTKLLITECKIDKSNRKSILLKFKDSVPQKSILWYGKGIINVVCNLKDDGGMAAPFFGPIEI